MNDGVILKKTKMPFCPGCGYNASVRSISKALKGAGYAPEQVILVSDIGCSGLVDPLFNTHTIHGLHGRSAALGLGVTLGLEDPNKKVVIIQGDGGATIGLQHILEASRRNVNMTHVVLNNLVYGMTGGQMSGLSPRKFKESRHSRDLTMAFDICKLANSAGASFVARVGEPKKFEKILTKAFKTQGFSLIELPSMCQPYGIKKLVDLSGYVGSDMVLKNKRSPFNIDVHENGSLFDEKEVLPIKFHSQISGRFGVVLAGSAGGGVQLAAKLLTSAGVRSGLSATMKGEYPITVGTGFSMAEVIFSRNDINFSGLLNPKVMIILSEDGLAKVKPKMNRDTIVVLDSSVDNTMLTSDKVIIQDFTKNAGKKDAALMAVAYWLETFGSLELEALIEAARFHKYGEKLLKVINRAREPSLV